MIKEGHLEIYDVELTVETPVFIGSGRTINKKEYMYDDAEKMVSMLDMQALMKMLVEKELIDEYERLILGNAYEGGMNEFLSSYLTKDEIKSLTLYQCSVKGVFDTERPHNDVKQFVRLNDGRPYIPGSSLKGVLRTCLWASIMSKIQLSDEDFGNFLKIIYRKDRNGNKVINTKFMADADRAVSEEVFNTLNLDLKKANRNAVNSIMRSISISDSEPISLNSMTICNKVDIGIYGRTNKPNVLRECIRPGTKVKFKLTIDRGFNGLSIDDICDSVKNFFEFYNSEYLPHFRLPENAESITALNNTLSNVFLGGGAGFFSKTVVYNVYAYDDALDYVSEWMEDTFRNHHHEWDYDNGMSPHMLKYTQYGNSLMHFGICKFEAK